MKYKWGLGVKLLGFRPRDNLSRLIEAREIRRRQLIWMFGQSVISDTGPGCWSPGHLILESGDLTISSLRYFISHWTQACSIRHNKLWKLWGRKITYRHLWDLELKVPWASQIRLIVLFPEEFWFGDFAFACQYFHMAYGYITQLSPMWSESR